MGVCERKGRGAQWLETDAAESVAHQPLLQAYCELGRFGGNEVGPKSQEIRPRTAEPVHHSVMDRPGNGPAILSKSSVGQLNAEIEGLGIDPVKNLHFADGERALRIDLVTHKP